MANNLKLQKRLAMDIMKVGQRTVWLNPLKRERIAGARTRAAIRELIEEGGIICRKPLRPGQRWEVPAQYMTRYRQRLRCDPAVRRKGQKKKAKQPTSGYRYVDKKYWKPKRFD